MTKELKYLLNDDGKVRRPCGVVRNSEVVITNRLSIKFFFRTSEHQNIRTSESSISNLTNSLLMLSESSQVLKGDKVNDDYNIMINLKDLKKESQKNLSCKKCHENKIKQKIAHFVSLLEKYEVKQKCDVSKIGEEGKFDAPDGILDKNKYLEYLISSRHSPLYLYSMYECVDDTFRRSCNPVEISSKSTRIASKIIETCGVKEHTWYVLSEVRYTQQNQ